MRSKAYCLFVLLTLVVFNLAADDFCEPADLTKLDCADKALNADDVKWNFITAFNNRKHIPRQNRETVEVDFNRALLLEFPTTPGTSIQFSINFKAKKKENCKFVLRRQGSTNLADFQEKNADFSFVVNQGETVIVAVFDPECKLYAELSKLEQTDSASNKYSLKAMHLFTRNVQTELWPEEKARSYTWTKKDGSTQTIEKILGNYIFAHHDGHEGNVHQEIKERNSFFHFGGADTGKKMECYHLCKYGSLFEFETARGLDFANTFKVKNTCQRMTIFLSDEPGYKMAGAEISFRHGFVTLPKEVKAFPMDFEKYDTDNHEVTVLYYLTTHPTKPGELKANLIIANSHGQAVRSTEILSSSQSIFFEFDDPHCLDSVIGQEMLANNKMKEHDFLNTLNLGILVAKFDNYHGYRYAEQPESATEAYANLDMTVRAVNDWVEEYVYGQTEAQKGRNATGEEAVMEGTKPPATLSPGYTNGQMEPIATNPPFGPKEDELIRAIDNEKKRRAEQIRSIMNNKYYFYWAIPAGFGAGSIAAVIICNIIMFVMRRSVCTFWYKAMYKRYGSDTTMGAGTTMGKTGGGETIGGGTTAGGTTSGGTTAGGTTAGETVGSTTAA